MQKNIIRLLLFFICFCFSIENFASPPKKKKNKTVLRQKKPKKPKKPKKLVKFDFTKFQNSPNIIEQIFYNHQNEYNNVLANSEQNRMQVIYTRIDRDVHNNAKFITYNFRVDPKVYFYPASCVKLPLTAMCLEKLSNMNVDGVTKETRLQFDSAFRCQYGAMYDSSSYSCYPSFAHYIKKILLVSDNDAYNRLWEFLGTKHIHHRLKEIGLPDVRVTHRFAMCDKEANCYSNPILFFDDDGKEIYREEMKCDTSNYFPPIGKVLVGRGYKDLEGKDFDTPKDFTDRNYFCLRDIDAVLKRIMFPDNFKSNERFNMTERDYRFMRKYMSMYATESANPLYDTAVGYFDCIKKYLIYGQSRDTSADKDLRIFNIVGFSYGFLVDVAYVVDFNSGAEFILSSVIYSNNDEVLDGKYEYYTTGMPFLKQLGQHVLELERNRQRKFLPDLDYLKFDYKRSE